MARARRSPRSLVVLCDTKSTDRMFSSNGSRSSGGNAGGSGSSCGNTVMTCSLMVVDVAEAVKVVVAVAVLLLLFLSGSCSHRTQI